MPSNIGNGKGSAWAWLILILLLRGLPNISTPDEITVKEGNEAGLIYQFDNHVIAPFEIRRGGQSGNPFYMHGQFIEGALSASQKSRFSVVALHSPATNSTKIELIIKNVERTDEGSYICTLKQASGDSVKGYILNIQFSPGKANCVIKPYAAVFDLLECSAKGGNPPGEIPCLKYNKERWPVYEDVKTNMTHIMQATYIDKDNSAFCCARNEVNRYLQDCNDFTLDRSRPEQTTELLTSHYNPSSQPNNMKTENEHFTTTICTSLPSSENNLHTDNPNTFNAAIIVVPVLTIFAVILIVTVGYCLVKTKSNDSGTVAQNRQPPSTNRLDKTQITFTFKDENHQKHLIKKGTICDESRVPPEIKPGT